MTSLSWRLEHQLDHTTYAALQSLWEGDAERNPFAAPAFLRAMSAAMVRGDVPVWALGTSAHGSLAAAWPLRLDRGRAIRFLPFDYSDQRTCLALGALDQASVAEGLALALRGTHAASLALTNVPAWGATLGAVQAALRSMHWAHRAFPAWPCPVLRVPPGDEAGRAMRAAMDQHKRIRGYANGLRREPGFAFEVAEDAQELETWHREFCDAHERRWDGTDTPSVYRSAAARELFLAALAAWHTDHVLVRFTIRVDAGPLAFVAALRAGTRLVYHHVATSPAGERHRAGHVLIRLIGIWMSERNFDTLDFGAGGEEYKTRYATGNDALWRVFAAPHRISKTYVRGLVEERIRRSPALQQGWDEWVNRRVRGALRRRLARNAPHTVSGKTT